MWTSARTLTVSRSELNLDVVLRCGQSFRWKLTDNGWMSTLRGRVYRLRQHDDGVEFAVWEDKRPTNGSHRAMLQRNPEEALKDYLQLDVSLVKLYSEWSDDPLFKDDILPGVRILRQEPLECLMSFILSSCNNIPRISQMVDELCTYGPQLAVIDGTAYHDFPSLEDLSKVGAKLEPRLREAGFGYRAAYIAKAVYVLKERGGEKWLRRLREESYETARKELMMLAGVGYKVADCVCLMALDKPAAVPVDTHVFKIARQHMTSLQRLQKCSTTVYPHIAEWFLKRFGPWSGWAQGVLFATRVRQTASDSLEEQQINGCTNIKKTTKRKHQELQ
ncbi:N-glycosylase/DNA lyase-like [Tropilaelaps mercedesae]|uniref:DNA-(apurinic or apyrimidinic site) lyase n=1 Tax=Tropilaelaps mercedesae TaxID=418985 RepID=A0A1V9XFL9_9ACAR|nr:N-glycosylase/DNA lyase-like [Tropilaelaps mercedesae]